MGVIVVSLPCTTYHWGSLSVLCQKIPKSFINAGRIISNTRKPKLRKVRVNFLFFLDKKKKQKKINPPRRVNFFQHFLFGATTAIHLRQFHLILNADIL